MNHCQLWAQKSLSEIKLNCRLHSIQPHFSHSQPLPYCSEEYFSSHGLPFCNNHVPSACILLWQTLNESKSFNQLLCFYVNLHVQRLMLRPLLRPLSSLGDDLIFFFFSFDPAWAKKTLTRPEAFHPEGEYFHIGGLNTSPPLKESLQWQKNPNNYSKRTILIQGNKKDDYLGSFHQHPRFQIL